MNFISTSFTVQQTKPSHFTSLFFNKLDLLQKKPKITPIIKQWKVYEENNLIHTKMFKECLSFESKNSYIILVIQNTNENSENLLQLKKLLDQTEKVKLKEICKKELQEFQFEIYLINGNNCSEFVEHNSIEKCLILESNLLKTPLEDLTYSYFNHIFKKKEIPRLKIKRNSQEFEKNKKSCSEREESESSDEYRFEEKLCSKITDDIFIGGHLIAKEYSTLKGYGITHILNFSKITSDEYFPKDFLYRSYTLLDDGHQSILGLMYEVIQYIDEAIKNRGKVFLHCEKGISRSSTFLIGYLMYKNQESFNDVHKKVKQIRKIISPNTGFIVQLLKWEKIIKTKSNLLFRIGILNGHQESQEYSPILCEDDILDERTNFIYVNNYNNSLSIWKGKESNQDIDRRTNIFTEALFKMNFEKLNFKFQDLKVDYHYKDLLKKQINQEKKERKKCKLFKLDLNNWIEMKEDFTRKDLDNSNIYILSPLDIEEIIVWGKQTQNVLLDFGMKFLKDHSTPRKRVNTILNKTEEFWEYF